jgi:serpin B
MKKAVFTALAVTLVLSMCSCGTVDNPTSTQTNPLVETLTEEYGQYLKAEVNYDSSPDVSDSTLQTLIEGNNEFAFDLYKQLISTEDGNLFYSPYSISLALAMTYAGANGQTAEQMEDVLNFLLEDEELHAAFNKLTIELNSRNQTSQSSTGFKLNVINAIWGSQTDEFMSAFLNVLAENYNAGMRVMDFEKDPEGCRQAINEWVSEQTEGLITELLPMDSINTLTALVLTNAIYFNAAWLFRFDKFLQTHDDVFFLPDGNTITVPMMHQQKKLGYTEGSGYQAVELKYDTWNMSMVIILPDKGTFEEFENSLTGEKVNDIIGDITDDEYVNLSMPKFDFESSFNLKETLESMGMTDAFGMAADFSGIFGTTGYWLDEVYHQAYITVDEDGTTAAAASGVVVVKGTSPDPFEINLNHPFIFMIRDIETNTILFVGRVMNPAA